MRTTLNIDDEILNKASYLTGVKEKTSLDSKSPCMPSLSANSVWRYYLRQESSALVAHAVGSVRRVPRATGIPAAT
jgi:hypothetical protein